MQKKLSKLRNKNHWEQSYHLGQTSWSRQGMPHLFKEFIDLVDGQSNKSTLHLDLGCGAGVKTVEFAKVGLATLGIDVSSAGVKDAQKLIKDLGLHKICRVQQGSCLDLPLEPKSVSSISDILCFTHFDIEDQKKYLQSVSRVLAKGGLALMVLFSDKDEHFHGHPVSKSYYFSFDPKNPLMKGYAHYEGMYNVHFGKRDIEAAFKDFEIVKMKEFTHPNYDYRRLWNVILKKL